MCDRSEQHCQHSCGLQQPASFYCQEHGGDDDDDDDDDDTLVGKRR